MVERVPLLALSHDAVQLTVHIHETQNRTAAQQMAHEERATREVKRRGLRSRSPPAEIDWPANETPTKAIPVRSGFDVSAIRKVALNAQLGEVGRAEKAEKVASLMLEVDRHLANERRRLRVEALQHGDDIAPSQHCATGRSSVLSAVGRAESAVRALEEGNANAQNLAHNAGRLRLFSELFQMMTLCSPNVDADGPGDAKRMRRQVRARSHSCMTIGAKHAAPHRAKETTRRWMCTRGQGGCDGPRRVPPCGGSAARRAHAAGNAACPVQAIAFVERVADYCRTKDLEIHKISAATADLRHEVRRLSCGPKPGRPQAGVAGWTGVPAHERARSDPARMDRASSQPIRHGRDGLGRRRPDTRRPYQCAEER